MSESRFKPSLAQWRLAGFLLVLTLATFAFWGLRADQVFRQTAALFVGLPALLAIGLALSAPASTRTGDILKGSTIFLLMLGPVLREGFICVLMMSPLFYAVVLGIASSLKLIDRKTNHNKLSALALIPIVAVLSLENANGPWSFPSQASVTASRIIAASPAQVQAALARNLRFDAPLPVFLRLGFPKPLENQDQGLLLGSRRSIRFEPGDAVVTFKVVSSQLRNDGGTVLLVHELNTTPVERWLRLEGSELRWQELKPGQTRLEWTLRFSRRLAPAWYFHPLELYGVGQAAQYLTQTLDLR